MNNIYVRLAILIFGLFLCIGLLRSIVENFQRTDLVGERETVLQKEEQRNAELRNQLKAATSAAFIEQQARNKLGLVRQGDTVILIGPSSQPQNSLGVNGSGETNLSRWQKWWSLFF